MAYLKINLTRQEDCYLKTIETLSIVPSRIINHWSMTLHFILSNKKLSLFHNKILDSLYIEISILQVCVVKTNICYFGLRRCNGNTIAVLA